MTDQFGRRAFIGGLMASGVMLATPAQAQGLGLGSILGKASDKALDRLAQPDAFYDDKDVRVGLPMLGKSRGGLLGTILDGASQIGMIDPFIRTLNNAAGTAAGEAKPIFRDAINGLSLSDVPGIARNSNGGTTYLRESSNDRLHGKLEPLIDSALGDLGAYRQLDQLGKQHSWLGALGLDRAGLNRTVTDQGLDGIFTYIGREEKAFRRNPLKGILSAF